MRAVGACGIDGDRWGMAELDDQIEFATFTKQLEADWGGFTVSADVPNEMAMKAVQSEKEDAEQKELRDSGSRPEATAIDGEKDVEEHELMALALDVSRKIHVPYPYPYQAASGESGSAVADRLRVAAAAEDKKEPSMAEPKRAPAIAEAAAQQGPPGAGEETCRWYAQNPWRKGFVERGSTPRMTPNAGWVAVDEVFDKNKWIPEPAWGATQEGSRFFGKILRHGENASWAPTTRENDR
jgi:hypothetical protein